MKINREILMTIVKNSSNRLEGEQEILEINEKQLHIISKELNELFSLNSVMHPLPSKEDAEIELSNMLVEIEKNTKESYLKRTILKGIEIGFKKGYNYMKGNCA